MIRSDAWFAAVLVAALVLLAVGVAIVVIPEVVTL